MTDERTTLPVVLVARDGYRLVRQFRNQASWPGLVDLTLERQAETAMGDPTWVRVTSWCVGPQVEQNPHHMGLTDMALLMLLDPQTPLFKAEDRR